MVETYSQSYQDFFVSSIIGSNGTYIELGAQRPIIGNNTYLLEKKYQWSGVSIEVDKRWQKDWAASNRKNEIIWENALTIDYNKLLESKNLTTNIDYLSCDLEPAYITFCSLCILINSKIRPKIITYEHDQYRYTDVDYSIIVDKFLKSYGYKIAVDKVTTDTNNDTFYETWFVREDISFNKVSYKDWLTLNCLN